MPSVPVEPVGALENATDIPDTRTPERLKNILDALSTYHKSLLMKNSINSQQPNKLVDIEYLLAKKGDILNTFILSLHPVQEGDYDPDLYTCLTILSTNLLPWNPQITTLAQRWCSMMFKEYPFTVTPKHIEQLFNNAVEEVETDGTGPEPQSDEES
jgi:hypothetical protein